MTNLIGWADYTAIYDRFRVLAMEVEFIPNNRYDKLTTVTTAGVGCIDRDSNSALASLTAGFGNSSARGLSLDDPWTDSHDYVGSKYRAFGWKMDGVCAGGEGQWITTATPQPTTMPTIKFYFQNLTASTTYGVIYQRVMVQFSSGI